MKTQHTDRENNFKSIAVGSIIDLSVKLAKPLTSKIQGDKAEDEKKEVAERLSKRTIESLSDTLSDLNAECFATLFCMSTTFNL